MRNTKGTSRTNGPLAAPSPADAVEFYEKLPEIYARNDRWLAVSHRWIHKFIDNEGISNSGATGAKCLNLGSGGLSYGIPEETVVHVDVYPKRFAPGQNVVVADIQDLPPFNHHFDSCICVGSVLNHCDAAAVINGVRNTLKPGGRLVLDFETSGSLELLLSGHFGKHATVTTTFYHDRTIRLWAYSESYICNLLASNGFVITRRSSCHHLSPLVYLLVRNGNFAARFHVLDSIARRLPVFRRFASHVIYACRLHP